VKEENTVGLSILIREDNAPPSEGNPAKGKRHPYSDDNGEKKKTNMAPRIMGNYFSEDDP